MMSSNNPIVKDRVTVFTSGHHRVFRIPALVYIKHEKVLLAFAEKRKTEDDASTEELVMKRGEITGDKIQWHDGVVSEARMTDHRPMNPCPVYDETKKRLFLFFNCIYDSVPEWWQIQHYHNMTRLCYITSEDAGLTWSNVTDLTDKLPQIRNWATFSVGPGHGLQTHDRLVVPAYAYTLRYKCDGKSPVTEPHALSLYSHDNGETWQFGKMLDEISLECQMAEVCDENGAMKIYCNARTKGGKRVETVSEDDNNTFKVLSKTLVETGKGGCEGSVISFPGQGGQQTKGKNISLLYIHPTDTSDRKDLGVYVNTTPCDPTKWSKPSIINKGPSGYSDVAHIDDKRLFVCLFECGVKKYTEKIDSVLFSYDDSEKVAGGAGCCSFLS